VRAVVQRIKKGSVSIDQKITGSIEYGLLVYLGVEDGDTEKDVHYMVEKICNLRIFEDEQGKMNRSVIDVQAGILGISQFTLLGDCRKGRRPNFTRAGEPIAANHLYEGFLEGCKGYDLQVASGVFQEHMMVSSINDGPVTILIDSKKNF